MFVGVYFCRLAFFPVLSELAFAIMIDMIFKLDINFCDFQMVVLIQNKTIFIFYYCTVR